MKKSDVKIGMKVVPFKKTVKGWHSLSKSAEWKSAEKGFLYVVEWDEDGYWVLSARSNRNNPHKTGDFFNSGDFKPYER